MYVFFQFYDLFILYGTCVGKGAIGYEKRRSEEERRAEEWKRSGRKRKQFTFHISVSIFHINAFFLSIHALPLFPYFCLSIAYQTIIHLQYQVCNARSGKSDSVNDKVPA